MKCEYELADLYDLLKKIQIAVTDLQHREDVKEAIQGGKANTIELADVVKQQNPSISFVVYNDHIDYTRATPFGPMSWTVPREIPKP